MGKVMGKVVTDVSGLGKNSLSCGKCAWELNGFCRRNTLIYSGSDNDEMLSGHVATDDPACPAFVHESGCGASEQEYGESQSTLTIEESTELHDLRVQMLRLSDYIVAEMEICLCENDLDDVVGNAIEVMQLHVGYGLQSAEHIKQLEARIDKFAKFIRASIEGEPNTSESAVDCAIRIIGENL